MNSDLTYLFNYRNLMNEKKFSMNTITKEFIFFFFKSFKMRYLSHSHLLDLFTQPNFSNFFIR